MNRPEFYKPTVGEYVRHISRPGIFLVKGGPTRDDTQIRCTLVTGEGSVIKSGDYFVYPSNLKKIDDAELMALKLTGEI